MTVAVRNVRHSMTYPIQTKTEVLRHYSFICCPYSATGTLFDVIDDASTLSWLLLYACSSYHLSNQNKDKSSTSLCAVSSAARLVQLNSLRRHGCCCMHVSDNMIYPIQSKTEVQRHYSFSCSPDSVTGTRFDVIGDASSLSWLLLYACS
ncbi:hypothetical protein BaRGS_00014903 [Batillaria attramentaria]|uniref:Uncharacterized protein n=1 Tax=Batillaria attramentaria TaxID=370345 RepID=A0ABD0L364_9CAEN